MNEFVVDAVDGDGLVRPLVPIGPIDRVLIYQQRAEGSSDCIGWLGPKVITALCQGSCRLVCEQDRGGVASLPNASSVEPSGSCRSAGFTRRTQPGSLRALSREGVILGYFFQFSVTLAASENEIACTCLG